MIGHRPVVLLSTTKFIRSSCPMRYNDGCVSVPNAGGGGVRDTSGVGVRVSDTDCVGAGVRRRFDCDCGEFDAECGGMFAVDVNDVRAFFNAACCSLFADDVIATMSVRFIGFG